VLLLKIIYHQLWEKNIDWDQLASEEIQRPWKMVMDTIIEFDKLKIPRWTGYGNKIVAAEIHVFGDASEATYGSVAYAQLQKMNEDPYVVLLTSKTKVVPLPKRKVTLPRLELLRPLLAVRFGEAVRKALHIQHWKVTYWSDSLVALGWIRGEPNRWKPFVRNQMETIQSVSEKEWWKHCPGVKNPADLASRGAPAPALVNSQLWWNGPEWLKDEENSWPNSSEQDKQDTAVQENIEVESRGAAVSVTAAITASTEPIGWDINRVSSWNTLLRRTA
jgi:L-rhamnose mutarotase